jgi:hypothetical protein
VPLRTKKGRPAVSNVKALLRELESSDDEGSADDAGPSTTQADPAKPWLKEFNQYLDTTDELSDGQTLVQWWGVSACLIDINLVRVDSQHTPVECTTISGLGVSRSRSFGYHGIFSIQRAGLFICGYHH